MGMNESVWAFSSTGTRAHAFIASNGKGVKQAMCRSSINRKDDALYYPLAEMPLRCARCVKLFVAMVERAEASMQPATEAHDLGHVAPVDERKDLPVQVDAEDEAAENLVGRTFSKMVEHWDEDGERADYEARVEVTEIRKNYVDPWYGEEHAYGVRFRITNMTEDGNVNHTSLPLHLFRAYWVDNENVTELFTEPTKEEKLAEVNREFPRGTRVVGQDNLGTTRTGTATGWHYGMVDVPGHPNYGRVYLGVEWDAADSPETGYKLRERAFSSELKKI